MTAAATRSPGTVRKLVWYPGYGLSCAICGRGVYRFFHCLTYGTYEVWAEHEIGNFRKDCQLQKSVITHATHDELKRAS